MIKYKLKGGVVDIFKLIVMVALLGYAGFKANGIDGVLTTFNNLKLIMWEWLKILNTICVSIMGDGFLTNLFLHYIVYALVGFLFEVFTIKKGKFGKIFGKVAYWLLGIPVSFILNELSNLLFH